MIKNWAISSRCGVTKACDSRLSVPNVVPCTKQWVILTDCLAMAHRDEKFETSHEGIKADMGA